MRMPSYPPIPRFGHIAILALVLATSGCETVPQPLQGNFSALNPGTATAQDATGTPVRWGGTIAAVETLPDQTCFQLVAQPLNEQSRPVGSDHADGRFIACRQGFYEPQVFAQGRSLTVTGHVVGYETRKVGEYDYRQPRVAADVIYLWPRQQDVVVVNDFYPFYPYEPWPSFEFGWRRHHW